MTVLEQPFSLHQDKYLHFFIFKLLLFGNHLFHIAPLPRFEKSQRKQSDFAEIQCFGQSRMTFFFLIFPGNIDILGPFPNRKFQSELSSPFVQLQHRIIILEGLINLLIIFYSILGVHQALVLPGSRDLSHLRRFLPPCSNPPGASAASVGGIAAVQ